MAFTLSHQQPMATLSLGKSLKVSTPRVFKKHIVAPNRLAAIANMPKLDELASVNASQYHRFQHLCKFLGSIPSDQL
jgi:hypothetical protein